VKTSNLGSLEAGC